MQKLPEEIKQAIRRDLLAGESVRDTAELFGVSRKTVQRIKKEMPDALLPEQSDNPSSLSDYSITNLSKSEEELVKKLNDEWQAFEDREEGWVFHVTKGDYLLRTSGKWWCFIVYPESAPPDWKERLKALGCEVAISPLHDKDKWNHDSPACVDPKTGEIIPKGGRYKAGDPKKPHYHGLIKFDQTQSARYVNRLIRSITCGPYLQKCNSLKRAFEYFWHENDPEKYQNYDKAEIIKMNDFTIEPNKKEQNEIMWGILKEAREKRWETPLDVLETYGDDLDAIGVITGRPGFLNSVLKSNYNRAHKEERPLTNEDFNRNMKELIDVIKDNQEDRNNGKN